MLKNYLKIALKHLFREKIFSLINITGLAIGFACTALIFLWVNDELSYDDFHKNKNQIYRILVKTEGFKTEGINRTMAITPGKLAEAIKNEIPEVKYITRNNQNFRTPFKYKENGFYEDNVFQVDNDFFKMFSFKIVKGNSVKPFTNINDMVISQRIAEKYFGKENPVGKILRSHRGNEYNVSAVIENMPANSHMHMDIMQSHMGTEKYWKGGYSWTNYLYETYILINDNADPESITNKINNLLNKNNTISNFHVIASLQPLSDIYLNPDITNSDSLTSDKKYISIFSIIALAILLIACINFVNISTANSISRYKEIGVRKVLGSGRNNLIKQFMIEFAVLTFIAALLSLLMLKTTIPYFNHFTGKELSINLGFYFAFSVIVILTSLFGGSYPAFYLSAYSPDRILKNKFTDKKYGISLRSALVVFQFSISILLIISTILVNNQLDFIQNKKLGFDKENVLYIPAKGDISGNFKSAKEQLLKYTNITNVSMKECPPTETVNGGIVTWNEHSEQNLVLRIMRVTPDYFGSMDIKLTEGRLFSKDLASDKTAFILNQAAVEFLGIQSHVVASSFLDTQSPVGKTINTWGRDGEIIGIVNNTYFKSLHHKIEPLIFIQLPQNRYGQLDYTAGSIIIRFSDKDFKKVISNIKTVWNEYNPNMPFEYHFLNNKIEQKYGFEQRLSKIFTVFSLLAIFISCLGLYSLITFVAVNRTKEIGIRKVMGASISVIVMSLSKDFVKWTLIANIISWPIAWYTMSKWLQSFAYRIDITILPFILAAISALIIALVTVSYRSVKAATSNPVEALRCE